METTKKTIGSKAREVRMDDEFYTKATQRAKSAYGISFSAYVRMLIQQDINSK